jgi:hypothetical protein
VTSLSHRLSYVSISGLWFGVPLARGIPITLLPELTAVVFYGPALLRLKLNTAFRPHSNENNPD